MARRRRKVSKTYRNKRLFGNPYAGTLSSKKGGAMQGNPNAGQLSVRQSNLSGSKMAGRLSEVPMGKRAGTMKANTRKMTGEVARGRKAQAKAARGKGGGSSKDGPKSSWTRRNAKSGKVHTVTRRTGGR